MNLNMADIEPSSMNVVDNVGMGCSNDINVNTMTVDDGYEPTYEEAFPPLPSGMTGNQNNSTPTQQLSWKILPVKSSTVTQVFCVPVEERKFKELNFGESSQTKICGDIKQQFGVSIEFNSAKDQSLTVVVTGKAENVRKARKEVIKQLQTQGSFTLNIPKEHHRFILGHKGEKLKDLQLNTATHISLPRLDDQSNEITIVGTKEGIDLARHEIQIISDEQAKLAFERIPVPKVYHPFICGPDGRSIKALQEQTGARISVPPLSVMKDEIAVAGEKEGVLYAAAQIKSIWKDMEVKCKAISVEVRKSQHKYVIGPRGINLTEILDETGVSVEVPSIDSESDTITLRGEQSKLGIALTQVYAKANSIVIANVHAPAWIHRFIIGKKGANINKITQEYPKVHIEFQDGEEKIELEGPPAEVDEAQRNLQATVNDFLNRMDCVELVVDPKFHKHIIGKQGSNVSRIKDETGVQIRIPQDGQNDNKIKIEGEKKGVQVAKQELMDMVHKLENERSRDILIDQRFHKTLIGTGGSKIKEIRDKFNQVQIVFPTPGVKNDVVTLRGPKTDVDKCHYYLTQMNKDLVANNYLQEVHIFKQFHKNIIGKGGATIKKIKDETSTKIELPSENSESDVISITGKRANVDEAKARIEAIQKELANIKEISVDIPSRYHNSIIGAKGRLIQSVMQECGGVIIRFPPEGSKSDKVTIRGPKDDVEQAKKQLIELAGEKKESGHTAEIKAKPEYHKFLIGRGGANIRKVRDSTGARVIFPNANDSDKELILIIGKKEGVQDAKLEIETLLSTLENKEEKTVTIDPKHHRHFVVRRGEVLREIAENYGGVSVSFPRNNSNSDLVVVKGAKGCVDGAIKRLLEIVEDLEAQITIDCVIPQKYHRTVMGQKGYKVQEITKEHGVTIKFPDRPTEQALINGSASDNGSAPDTSLPLKWDVIAISGRKENCEAAHAALQALIPITREVKVQHDYHRYIIGGRGAAVREMMDKHDVNISIPSADSTSDAIVITGAPNNVEAAEKTLLNRVKELDDEQEDRELRGFTIELHVDPVHHPKIIGRKGAVISKIRELHKVNIQFPDRDSDLITITGYESKANAAKQDIMKIVTDLEARVTQEVELDNRVHSRLIGYRGKSIRKIMDEYDVEIKFPRAETENPNLVTITGLEENVIDCSEYLYNQENEFIHDELEKEQLRQYERPSRQYEPEHRPMPQEGFKVRNAPWSEQTSTNGAASHAPDTASTSDFPEFGTTAVKKSQVAWGPSAKRFQSK